MYDLVQANPNPTTANPFDPGCPGNTRESVPLPEAAGSLMIPAMVVNTGGAGSLVLRAVGGRILRIGQSATRTEPSSM